MWFFVIMHLQDICTYYTSFHSQPVLSFPCEIEIKNDRLNPYFVNVQKQDGLHFIFYIYKRVIMAISFKRISRDHSKFISFSLVTEAVICIGIIHQLQSLYQLVLLILSVVLPHEMVLHVYKWHTLEKCMKV